MKLDRRTLSVGALAVAALVALSAREARHSACTGGACCLPFPGLMAFSTNDWAPVSPTNQPPATTPVHPLTNSTH